MKDEVNENNTLQKGRENLLFSIYVYIYTILMQILYQIGHIRKTLNASLRRATYHQVF